MLTRVIAVTSCVTFAAALAARQGPTPMAAFQICLQVWLTSSLLADGLAVAGQVGIALLPSSPIELLNSAIFDTTHESNKKLGNF
jgi:hypothetical protein